VKDTSRDPMADLYEGIEELEVLAAALGADAHDSTNEGRVGRMLQRLAARMSGAVHAVDAETAKGASS